MMADDPYNLQRFLDAQERVYETVLLELKSGQKRSHWIWFIFPQIEGLGFSAISREYAIKSLAEARAYMAHPILGKRLVACAEALFVSRKRSIAGIMGYPDDLKLRSSATLFELVSAPGSIFSEILRRFFHDERCELTLSRAK